MPMGFLNESFLARLKRNVTKTSRRKTPLSLLQTCHQIREEASRYAEGKIPIQLSCHNSGIRFAKHLFFDDFSRCVEHITATRADALGSTTHLRLVGVFAFLMTLRLDQGIKGTSQSMFLRFVLRRMQRLESEMTFLRHYLAGITTLTISSHPCSTSSPNKQCCELSMLVRDSRNLRNLRAYFPKLFDIRLETSAFSMRLRFEDDGALYSWYSA